MAKIGALEKERKVEKIFCIIVAVVAIALIVAACFTFVFIPAAAIMVGLELFAICYYIRDDKSRKVLMYTLFGIGVLLLIFAVLYTIIKTR